MCLGMAVGVIDKANKKPCWDWKKDVEEYIAREKIKVPGYTEIFKLKSMLEDAEIPFIFTDESSYISLPGVLLERYHIEYPCSYAVGDRVCSVIQGYGTYGAEKDLLEIMGLLTDEEYGENGTVRGSLTAEDVFSRIKAHYEKDKVKE